MSASIKATQVGSDYLWQWHSTIRSAEGIDRAVFRQNNFAGAVSSLAELHRRAHDYVPQLNGAGAITLKILQQMQMNHRLDEIAQTIATDHPELYTRWQDALTRVGEISAKYGR